MGWKLSGISKKLILIVSSLIITLISGTLGAVLLINYAGSNSEPKINEAGDLEAQILLRNSQDGNIVTLQKESDEVDALQLEVAHSPTARQQGLMGRTYLSPNTGMVFVFDEMASQTFWMKNTLISLDIIFLDDNFSVIKIYKYAKANQTTEVYPSGAPAKYTVETLAGWADSSNLDVGDKFILIR